MGAEKCPDWPKMDLMNRIRVAIADDHPMVRVGVRHTLERDQQIQVVAEVDDGLSLLRALPRLRPDILLMDLEMPHSEDLVPKVHDCCPQTRVIILSSHTEARYLQPLRDQDICGFVIKEEAPERLLQAVRVVYEGETWFSHAVSQAFSGMARADRAGLMSKLTLREQQIFELMQKALDNAAIAEELSLSKQTVRRYATVIYEKLGVKNRIQAIVEADNAVSLN
jgi:DNA-binding NarL/FixJ family response regulator